MNEHHECEYCKENKRKVTQLRFYAMFFICALILITTSVDGYQLRFFEIDIDQRLSLVLYLMTLIYIARI